jgi:NAD(P)-dependent dehydrogenase (short-subunit alcohol dehydrogenase family)
MTRLRDRVAVVTGAASGIGRALACDLARRGARLAISDIDELGLAETSRQVSILGARSHVQVLDVSDRAAVLSYADAVMAEFGRVNLVINNAGIAFTGSIAELSFDQLERVMAVDYWGVVNGTKAFLPHLIASGDGHVVNISSVFGLFAVPGQGAYNAAKFAVRGFTEALNQELRLAGHPVRVTCVHPGGVKTAIARNAGAVARQDPAALAAVFDARLARTTAESAARQILRAVRRDRPRALIGADAKLLDLVVRLLGARYQGLFARVAARTTNSLSRGADGSGDSTVSSTGDEVLSGR